MWKPFRQNPPPPAYDPFEIEEQIARAHAAVALMGAAETRLLKAIKQAKQERQDLDNTIAGARRQRRGVGGKTW